MRRIHRVITLLPWLATLVALPGLAQSPALPGFPAKPVRVLVGYAAGGLPDTAARIVAQRLGDKWGHQVLVENRPSANSILAAELVAKAAPDGYTLLCADSSALVVNPILFQKLPYDAARDFAPVSLAVRAPLFLAIHPSVPANSLIEFISLAKSKPGQLNYGSSGVGSTHHLTMSALSAAAGIDVVHVPFKGTGQSVPALIAGQVSLVLSAFPSLAGFAKSNQVRFLAVNSGKRSRLAPTIPTIAEIIGQPNFDFAPPIGFLLPAKTPAALVNAISRDIAAVTRMPEVIKQMQAAGMDPVGSSAQEYAAQLKADAERYRVAIRQANLKAE